MKTLMIAAIAGAFAVTAAAQAPSATQAQTAADAKKDKQEMVKSATEGTAKGYTGAAAEGSAAAAKTKDQPKTLPQDKASKQQTAKSVTESTAGKGYGQQSAEGSAKAAADTSPRKEKPKPQAEQPGDERSFEALASPHRQGRSTRAPLRGYERPFHVCKPRTPRRIDAPRASALSAVNSPTRRCAEN